MEGPHRNSTACRAMEGKMQVVAEAYTIQEVAQILSVSVDTVRRLVKAGDINAARVGRVYRITRRDLNQFLRARGSTGLDGVSET